MPTTEAQEGFWTVSPTAVIRQRRRDVVRKGALGAVLITAFGVYVIFGSPQSAYILILLTFALYLYDRAVAARTRRDEKVHSTSVWLEPMTAATIIFPLLLVGAVVFSLLSNNLVRIGIALMCIAFGIARSFRVRRHPVAGEDLELLEGQSNSDIALVSVTMKVNGETIGIDHGLLWVMDGLVHFKGRSCYFAFSGGDASVQRFSRTRFHFDPDGVSRYVEAAALERDEAEMRLALGVIRAAEDVVFQAKPSIEPRTLPPFSRWNGLAER